MKWIVLGLGLFAYLSIFWWRLQHRREVELRLRQELVSRMMEQGWDQGLIRDWLRDERRDERVRHLSSVRLMASVSVAVGVGMFATIGVLSLGPSGMGAVLQDETIAAGIVTSIGVGLLAYSLLRARERRGDAHVD
jgi:hypothetical protein